MSPHDAIRALEAKVDGLIVSNHGGRQLDYVPAVRTMMLDCSSSDCGVLSSVQYGVGSDWGLKLDPTGPQCPAKQPLVLHCAIQRPHCKAASASSAA